MDGYGHGPEISTFLFEYYHIRSLYKAHYYTHYLLVSNNSVGMNSVIVPVAEAGIDVGTELF